MIKSLRVPLILFLFFLIIGCQSNNTVKPDSPENLSILSSLAIKNQSLEELKSYFTESRKEVLNDQYFNNLKGLNSAGTEHKTYSFLRMDNEMLLLEIIKDPESKTYKIQEIIKVPKEYEKLFNTQEN